MKKWKRVLSGMLAAVIAISLGACGQEPEKKKNKVEGEINASKGRYLETVASSPEGETIAMELLEDGTLRVVTTQGIFDSKDKGENWSPWDKLDPKMKEDFTKAVHKEHEYEYDKVTGAAVNRDGTVYYQVKGDEAEVYKLVAPDGTLKELTLGQAAAAEETSSLSAGNGILKAIFTGNGDLLCADARTIYQVDTKTLEVKHQYEPLGAGGTASVPEGETYVEGSYQYATAGDALYVMVEDMEVKEDGSVVVADVEVTVFNLNTFESEGEQNVLKDFLLSENGGNGELEKIFINGKDGKSLYIVNTSGIYRYLTEGTMVEKIFLGSLGKMSAPNNRLSYGIVMEDENFLLYYAQDNELICYNYDLEAPSMPEKTLKLYSLYDNTNIRQIMAAYQSKNPNVMVELEVGIKAGDAMTRTDALKTLNTNIMAGEGPDLLVTDGLPLDSYMEKGLLMDLKSVIEETEKNSPLFQNIVGSYEKEGAILAVPTRFSVPVMYGGQDILSKAENLNEFADLMETLRSERPDSKTVMGSLSPSLLLLTLMPASSPAWINEDGTLNQETLEQFVGDMKRISDAQKYGGNFKFELEAGKTLELSPFMCSTEYTVLEMGYAGADMSIGHIRTNSDLFTMDSMLTQMGGSSYKPMPGQSEQTFVPIDTVGVSVKGKEAEAAKDFISFMLQEAQNMTVSVNAGWPVNEKAFEELKKRPEYQKEELRKLNSDEGNGSFELNYVWPSEEKFQALKKMAQGLKTPAVTDEMIVRTVYEEVNKCLDGQSSVSDTADSIVEKVNLYLAE